ncbi:hypothetical protein EZV62_002930 [Acer yangbiense]|uniref:Protein kinase domain-containing protein n=1 Tax=Acer yangbiense TaxID=1000413 RepID=A0A5C7IYP8_9ROSI|nr:hypothetical protein EZV62_002930 [Acer yangbiense]
MADSKLASTSERNSTRTEAGFEVELQDDQNDQQHRDADLIDHTSNQPNDYLGDEEVYEEQDDLNNYQLVRDRERRDHRAPVRYGYADHRIGDELDLTQSVSLLKCDWVIINVASAIEYLHHHCQPPIVHGDLKPSNVLLDHDMVAHVGDFGLAKFLSNYPLSTESGTQSSSIGIKGTVGYVAPVFHHPRSDPLSLIKVQWLELFWARPVKLNLGNAKGLGPELLLSDDNYAFRSFDEGGGGDRILGSLGFGEAPNECVVHENIWVRVVK